MFHINSLLENNFLFFVGLNVYLSKTLFEYLERKELLEKSDQQSRLLREVPQIIAEEIEVEATPECRQGEIKQRNDDSPGPIIEKPVEAPVSDTSDDEFELTWTLDIEENVRESKSLQGVMELHVIDLSDDEESEAPSQKEQTSGDKLESLIWHYLDPQGEIQGPFAITLLKRWSDADYFPSDFQIWKTGQSPNEAVYLKDILNRVFPS
ncbi:Uncharacterized protein L484_000643 [Morus notabilis]|uniref:GYF domain-containing protein n=1 Tax=Morus notabilis TaxID=981085 RepID=W9QY21_9ROSA|nr:Uncharacterized protein L484_000643 [Morus notabilis]